MDFLLFTVSQGNSISRAQGVRDARASKRRGNATGGQPDDEHALIYAERASRPFRRADHPLRRHRFVRATPSGQQSAIGRIIMNTLLLLGLGLALVGIFVSVWGVRHYRRQGAQYSEASARWRKTGATILDSRIVERERSDSNDNSYTVYEPRLRYGYTASSRKHEGERIALCSTLNFSDPARAEQWLTTHAPGTSIEIWYDPARPQDCALVLDKPSLLTAGVSVVVGLGLALLGGWVILNLR
jgi:hypothetical protein